MATVGEYLTPPQAVEDLRRIAAVIQSAPIPEAMQACRDLIHESVRNNFEQQAAPDGPAWPPRRVVGDGHPLLDDTGFLKAAATGVGPGSINDVGGRSVDVGVDDTVDLGGIRAAARHNFGDGNMPEREFMAADEATEEACGEVIGDALERRFDGS